MRLADLGLLSLLCWGLSGCSQQPNKPDRQSDGPGDRQISARQVKDAVPRAEPLSRYGNHSPYTVLGKTYHLLASNQRYKKRGTASWYGKKFHGRKTSSGEVFDMYQATAAHKTLPLPTYAKVTNLENGHSIVVKINDRGPFVDDRLIDLSYAAATRLDMIRSGTARVEVESIDFGRTAIVEDTGPATVVLQVAALRDRDAAQSLRQRLADAGIQPVAVKKERHWGRRLFKIRIGPVSQTMANRFTAKVIELGLERPHKVKP